MKVKIILGSYYIGRNNGLGIRGRARIFDSHPHLPIPVHSDFHQPSIYSQMIAS
jgi:hypothetical protein